MTFRPSEPPQRVTRLALRATYFGIAIAAAATIAGCPGGAELEDPDRFPPVVGGTGPTTGGSTGVGGATAGAGMGGAAGSAGAGAGTAGTAGAAGTGAATWTWTCMADVTMALKQNCSRAGCHSTLDKYAGLDLTNPAAIAAQMVDKPAMHGDIACQPSGQPFRACTAEELLAKGCPPTAMLIDSQNPEASWVLTKLRDQQGDCGDPMPIAPGNSVSNGWNDERKLCYENFFKSLAASQ
jgi:hypothetical protein